MSRAAVLTEPAGPSGPGRLGLDLTRRRRPKEALIRGLLLLCGLVSVATTAGIVLSLIGEAVNFFRTVPLTEFLFTTRWSPSIAPKAFGVLPLLAGTMMIAAIAGLTGVPLGVCTAIYMSEYASPRVRRKLKPTLEILAGMPTVVLGYFALTFVTQTVLWKIFGPERVAIFNALSAGLVVGIMIVPTIASISEDAMSAVPQGLRQGAYALGSSRVTVAFRVVVPAAISGIMASVVLGVSRAVGETMIVAIAAGQTPVLHANPLQSIHTMTGYIVQVSLGDTPHHSIEYQSIFAIGMLLFVVTLLLNMVSRRLVRRFREVY